MLIPSVSHVHKKATTENIIYQLFMKKLAIPKTVPWIENQNSFSVLFGNCLVAEIDYSVFLSELLESEWWLDVCWLWIIDTAVFFLSFFFELRIIFYLFHFYSFFIILYLFLFSYVFIFSKWKSEKWKDSVRKKRVAPRNPASRQSSLGQKWVSFSWWVINQ